MAIVVGNYSYAGSVVASSIAIAPPTGITAGDLLLLAVTVDVGSGSNATISTPSEFTAVSPGPLQFAPNNSTALAVFYKVAKGSEPSSYTVNYSGTNPDYGAAALMWAFSGVATGAPIDASAGTSTGTTVSSTVVAPSVTPSAGRIDDLLVCVAGRYAKAHPTAYPSGMIHSLSMLSSGDYGEVATVTQQLSSDAATGTRTFAYASPENGYAAMSILLAPPGAPVLVPLWENF